MGIARSKAFQDWVGITELDSRTLFNNWAEALENHETGTLKYCGRRGWGAGGSGVNPTVLIPQVCRLLPSPMYLPAIPSEYLQPRFQHPSPHNNEV